MKNTQAWGWLAAGVLALGLNGMYQDGGAARAERVVNQVVGEISARTGGVLALAAGRADWFLAKTRMVRAQDETASCRLATAVRHWQTRLARTSSLRSQSEIVRLEAMSAREEAQMARLEANRARVEEQVEARVAGMRVLAADFNPVVCPRVRVSIPRVQVSIPGVHVDAVSLGSEE
jgi:hypothetical protein